MFRRTPPLSAMITTGHGQRRILKRPMPVDEYIRMAVESGVYRTNEEKSQMFRDRRLQDDPVKQVMKRFRQDIVRGASVLDYPIEYMILRQNPMPPEEPRVPVKQQKREERELREERKKHPFPIEPLIKQYMKRQNRQAHQSYEKDATPSTYTGTSDGAPLTSEEYYRRLLGVPEPQPSAFRLPKEQSSTYQKAHAAAVQHYKLVRTQGLSEEEAMTKVDSLLQQASQDELQRAAETLHQTQQLRQTPSHVSANSVLASKSNWTMTELQKEHENVAHESWRNLLNEGKPLSPEDKKRRQDERRKKVAPEEALEESTSLETVFENVLRSEPRVLEAMMRWSQRLQTIPYAQWTVGAATALDHWIARQVLRYSEETWETLMEGTTSFLLEPSYLERGKLLVQTRENLFPETILQETPWREDDDSSFDGPATASSHPIERRLERQYERQLEEEKEARDSSKKERPTENSSLEDLLSQLELDVQPDQDKSSFKAGTWDEIEKTETTLSTLDERVSQIVQDMQEWRTLHQRTPYNTWSPEKQREFNDWVENQYIPACAPQQNRATQFGSHEPVPMNIDLEATRNAILSSPPVTKEESDDFWSSLNNEKDAATLLDRMRNDGPPPGSSVLESSFWDLDYATQLQQLLNLGAVRPLLDEYTNESDRRAFVVKYGDVLLTGAMLDYLVPDPDGSITADDLRRSGGRNLDQSLLRSLKPDQRYRLETRPYRKTDDGEGEEDEEISRDSLETSRSLFKAWSEHKVHRATYEEHLFQTNRLGLTYDNPPKPESEMTYYDLMPEEAPLDVGVEKMNHKLKKRLERRDRARLRSGPPGRRFQPWRPNQK